MSFDRNASVEVIPNRLVFTSLRSQPYERQGTHYFETDETFVYEPFYADFGPVNLGNVYQYIKLLDKKMEDPALASNVIVYYTSLDFAKRANGAFLIGCYAVMRMGKPAIEVASWFSKLTPPLKPFRDASYGPCTYALTLEACLAGFQKGIEFGWIDFDKFDVEEYIFYERVENGDLTELIPGKYIAFCGPSSSRVEIAPGIFTFTPEDYLPIMRKKNVTAVVRFNKKMYDRRSFTRAGINHYDMYFTDGGTPTEAILRRFIEVSEQEKGNIAVHCKAGLGRTGTLIACYLMKHFRITAAEIIGYLRILRPGSVIGPQQYYLHEQQARMWRLGEALPRPQKSPEGSGGVVNGSDGCASTLTSGSGSGVVGVGVGVASLSITNGSGQGNSVGPSGGGGVSAVLSPAHLSPTASSSNGGSVSPQTTSPLGRTADFSRHRVLPPKGSPPPVRRSSVQTSPSRRGGPVLAPLSYNSPTMGRNGLSMTLPANGFRTTNTNFSRHPLMQSNNIPSLHSKPLSTNPLTQPPKSRSGNTGSLSTSPLSVPPRGRGTSTRTPASLSRY